MGRFSGRSANSGYPRRTGLSSRGKDSTSFRVRSTFTSLFPGSGPGIAEIKGIGVGARARILSVEGEGYPRLLQDHGVNVCEACADLVEREHFAQSEVQVFREAVVGEIAALKRRAPFEGKHRPQDPILRARSKTKQGSSRVRGRLRECGVLHRLRGDWKAGNIALRYQSGAPSNQQFFGWDVKPQAPLAKVRAFVRQRRIGDIGICQRVTKRLQFRFCGDAKQFQ